MGAHEKAEPLFQESLSIWKSALGEKHPDYVASLTNLADLYPNIGAYAMSEQLYREAASTMSSSSSMTFHFIFCLCGSASCSFALGRQDEGLKSLQQAKKMQMRLLEAVLPALPERRSMDLISRKCRELLTATCECAQRASDVGHGEIGRFRELYDVIWDAKGVLLDFCITGMLSDRSSVPLGLELRARLARLIFDSEAEVGKINKLVEEIETMEVRSGLSLSRLEPPFSAFPEGVAFADFVTVNGKYGMFFVCGPRGEGEGHCVQFFDLGIRRDIDRDIDAFVDSGLADTGWLW
jgi:hypothetical protein